MRSSPLPEVADRASAAFTGEIVALLPRLRAFTRMLAGSHADGEDLAQTTLARAWAARDSYTPGTNLKAWLFQIARNRMASNYRRAWRVRPLNQGVAEQTLVANVRVEGRIELDELRGASPCSRSASAKPSCWSGRWA